MDVRVVLLWTITSQFVSDTAADLPSCDRARCHHCRVTFIAKMCPETCEPCPKGKFLLDHEVQTKRTFSQTAKDPRQLANNFSRKPEASPLGGFIRTTIVNGSPNIYQGPQRPQAQAVSTQQLLPQPLPQKPPYAVQYNSISPYSSSEFYPYQQYSQQQVAGPQRLPVIPPPPPAPQQYEQTPLPVTAFPTFPTFTFPTLPPFTFPTVTFAPPLYRPPAAAVPQNQAAAQIPLPQALLPAPTQRNQGQDQAAQVFPSAQTVAPPAAASSQLQTYSHPQQQQQQQQAHAQHYAVQQAVPTYPVIRQPQLPAQEVQPQQRQPTYSQQLQQQQQQQQHQQQQQQQPYYATNQQTAAVPARPQPQLVQQGGPTTALVVPQAPALPVAYSIDAPSSSYIDKTYYETGIEQPQPPAATQCPRQPNWEPCISKEAANDRFRTCCKALGQGCAALCNYDATLTTIQLAVLTGRCPLSKVGDVMICASGYENATPCCEAYNVFEPGYEHCRPYCNPSAGLPQGGMLSEQYKCLGKLSQIQRCFYVSQRP